MNQCARARKSILRLKVWGCTVWTRSGALWQQNVNPDYDMTCFIWPRDCQCSSLKNRIWCWKREPFPVLLLLLRHMPPLMMEIVNSRCPTLRSWLLLHIFNIGWSKRVKRIMPQSNIFTMNVWIELKVIMLLLTPMIGWFSLKRCHYLTWRVRW